METQQQTTVVRNRPTASMAALTIASTLVLTTLAPAVPVPAGTQYDFPNPAPKHTIQVTTDVTYGEQGAEIAAPTPAPHRPIEWRNPARRRTVHRQTAPTLLPTLLQQTATTAPFTQTHWRNPQRAKVRQGNFSEFYAIDESTPFHQDEWKNPRAKGRAIETRTWTDRRALALDEPPKPHAQTNWPNPRSKGQSPELRKVAQSRFLAAVDTIDDTPQSLSEWPTPPRLRRSIALATWTQTLTLTTLAPAGTPPVPVVFPNPQGKARATDLRTATDGRRFYATDESPFGPTEWPIPVVRPVRVAETWTQNTIQGTLSTQFDPVFPDDRPNPQPRRVPTITFTDNLLQSTLDPGPEPRNQFDWPLFLPTAPPIDLRTWTQDRPFYYDDEQPTHQDEWPVPAPFRFPKGLGHWAPPQLGILGFPATADVEIVVRAHVDRIHVRRRETTREV